MPDLNKKYFSGEKDITAEKGKELVTKGDSEDVIRTLTKLGWEGQLIAAVSIKVSVDGRRADDGQFSLRGALASDPISVQAAKLWEKADEDVMVRTDVEVQCTSTVSATAYIISLYNAPRLCLPLCIFKPRL